MGERVLIIDGLNLFLRNWSANPTMDINGSHIGGALGSLRSIKNLVRDTKCTKAIVAWDAKGGSARRRSIYAEYKAGRKPRVNRQYDFDTLEESQKNLQVQYAWARRYLDMLGICQVEVENCEADDVISVLCAYVYEDVQKVIVSTDRDFWQLIGPKCIVWSPVRKVYYGPGEIKEETGVIPCNHIYVKAISGDSSDNIDGIRNLGPKTVVKFFPFLGEHESDLGEIRSAAQVLEPKGKREKELLKTLLEQWEVVITNVKLMQLRNPIVSPQSVRSIKHQIGKEPAPPNTTSIKLALLKEGIQLTDNDFFMVFNDYHARASAPAREAST